ncbi:MAG: hypothetical protein QOD39_2495 [Mycobacterium sp.]|nr:hypothetical protein [Mycobacterium sp.]
MDPIWRRAAIADVVSVKDAAGLLLTSETTLRRDLDSIPTVPFRNGVGIARETIESLQGQKLRAMGFVPFSSPDSDDLNEARAEVLRWTTAFTALRVTHQMLLDVVRELEPAPIRHD